MARFSIKADGISRDAFFKPTNDFSAAKSEALRLGQFHRTVEVVDNRGEPRVVFRVVNKKSGAQG